MDRKQEIVQGRPKIIKLKGSPRRRLNTHSDSPKSQAEKEDQETTKMHFRKAINSGEKNKDSGGPRPTNVA